MNEEDAIDTTAELPELPSSSPPAPAVAKCQHCSATAVLCAEHAGALVAQAFSEDESNRREGAARSAERKLRQGSTSSTHADDARELRHVLVRWFSQAGALAVAREMVRQLEQEVGG